MYRSKDLEYMNKLRNQLNQLTFNAGVNDTFEEVWEHFKKYIVVDDLNTYLLAQHANKAIEQRPEYVYNSNFSPDFMFVTISEHPSEISMLDSIISKANITSWYRTSYIKHSNFLYYKENPHLSQIIKNEISIVKPKVVIFFGLNTCSWSMGVSERHKEIMINNIPLMATSSLTDLLSSNKTVQEINTLKQLIWNDISGYIAKFNA